MEFVGNAVECNPLTQAKEKVLSIFASLCKVEKKTVGVVASALVDDPVGMKKILKVLQDVGFSVIIFTTTTAKEMEVLDKIGAMKHTLVYSHNAKLTAAVHQINVDVWIESGVESSAQLH